MSDAALFSFTSGPRDAKIIVVGEAWGKTEEEQQLPFVGGSGQELTRILADAGLDRSQCLLTNIVHARPYANEMIRFCYPNAEGKAQGIPRWRGVYARRQLIEGVQGLHNLIREVKPRIVIGLGNWPLWALTKDCWKVKSQKTRYTSNTFAPVGIASWRGSQLYCNAVEGCEDIPFLPTYHPAAIMRQWAWRYPMRHDLDVRARTYLMDGKKWEAPNWNFVVRPSFSQVIDTLTSLLTTAESGPLPLAGDSETRAGCIACFGIAWSKKEALCIPFMCVEGDYNYWTIDQELIIFRLLHRLFHHPNVRWIGQNFLYDLQYLVTQLFARPKLCGDTMIMQHLCWPGTPKGLDYISSLYCEYHRYWKDEGKTWDKNMNEDQLWEYNCKDCVATFESFDELTQLVDKLNLTEQLVFLMRQVPMLLDMMLQGVKVDTKRRAEVTMELAGAIAEREQWLEDIIPISVYPRKTKASAWYSSPAQTAELFYDVLGVKPVKNRKTGARTVDDKALTVIAQQMPILRPIVKVLKELRSLSVFHSTFCAAKLDPDKRFRCSWNIAGPETFRYSSSENAFGRGGNMQNIPAGREEDEE